MRKMSKKLVALLLVAMMLFSMTGTAFATEGAGDPSGVGTTAEHEANFASHTKDDFYTQADVNADDTGTITDDLIGKCKTDGCGYTLTDFRTQCPSVKGTKADDQDPESSLICGTCGAEIVEHTGIDTHTLASFYAESDVDNDTITASDVGTCKTDGCEYTLANFQLVCTVDHATIDSSATCENCSAAGTKVEPDPSTEPSTSPDPSTEPSVSPDPSDEPSSSPEPGDEHGETFEKHTKDSFDEDGACTVDGCNYTLAKFQEDCGKTADGHDWDKDNPTGACTICGTKCDHDGTELSEIAETGSCAICGVPGTHKAEYAAHTKISFTVDGTCTIEDCVYTLAMFQKDCTHDWSGKDGICKNCGVECPRTDNHANILPAASCGICGTSGTHVHEPADEYQSNATQHWKVCKLDNCPAPNAKLTECRSAQFRN